MYSVYLYYWHVLVTKFFLNKTCYLHTTPPPPGPAARWCATSRRGTANWESGCCTWSWEGRWRRTCGSRWRERQEERLLHVYVGVFMHYVIPVTRGKKTIERDLKHGLQIGWKSKRSILCSLGQYCIVRNFSHFINEQIEAQGLYFSKSTWLLITKSVFHSKVCVCLPPMLL